MATNSTRRDVELRINANDLSDKSLAQLLDTFDKLRESQDRIAKSGEGSQRSIRELKQELADLSAVAVELKSRASLVDQITALQQQADLAASRVEKAKTALAGFNAAQKEGAELTKKQQTEFNKLTREVAGSEKSLARTQSRLQKFNEELRQLGEGDVDATRQTLIKFSEGLAVSLGAAETAIRKYDETLRANSAQEKQAAADKLKLANSVKALKESLASISTANSFRQQGKDAEKAATSIDALTRDYDQLAVSGRKAGDAIRSIIDPSRQALTTLDGLEKQTADLNERLGEAQSSSKLRDEIRRLRGEYTSLSNDAGKAASSLADDIGRYRQTEQAVGTLRGQVQGAQQAVLKFAGQMRSASEPSAALAKSLGEAQAKLKGLVSDYERQSIALANLRTNLREAGVNTDKLADAEARLQNVARGVVSAQQQLGVAAVKVGEGADKGAKALSLFDDSGRKALSTAQRLRGQILSLASSYLGLFAAVNTAQGAIDASVSREGILKRLELIEGGVDAANAKFRELRKTADAIGVDFESTAQGFTKIAIGAKEAGVSSERLDAFYINLAKTTRGLALDGQKTQKVFEAVSQVFGKNKLQSEELVQQLGDALPGVVVFAQKALRLNAEELTKALESGSLSAESLIAIIDEYAAYTSKLSKNSNSAIDALTKFRNAVFDLKLALADSGFLEAFTKLLNDFSERAKRGEFNDAVKGLGTLFTLAAEGAKLLLENVNLVVGAFAAFAALNVAKLILGLAVSMKALGIGTGAAAVGTRAFGAALAFLAANPIVAAVLALGTLLIATETGRGAMRALWQVVVEVVGGLGDLVTLDFSGFATRVAGSMGRIGAAFRGAKKDADEFRDSARGGRPAAPSPGQLGIGGGGSFGDAPRVGAGGGGGSWAGDVAATENQTRAEAALTLRTVTSIEKSMTDMRKAAAKERAKVNGDVEAEVRAEYSDSQEKITDLLRRGEKTRDEVTIAAAKKQQAVFDATVKEIAKARRSNAAKSLSTRQDRGDLNAVLEGFKQAAELTKENLRIENAELEQSYKEGKASLKSYYDERTRIAVAGIDAEIQAARSQVVELEKVRSKDPTAAKKIVALEGEIARKGREKVLVERQFATEATQAAKALERQVAAIGQELADLTGDERKVALEQIRQYEKDQLELIAKLTEAEQGRQKVILDQVVAIKTQLADINLMRKSADQLSALRNAAIDSSAAQGQLSGIDQLKARSEANRLYLIDLEKQAEELVAIGLAGTEAYKAIQAQIIKLRGETDLLGNEITATFKEAASTFLTTLIDTGSPKKALQSFGKSLGNALAKSLVDEAATSITKYFKEAGFLDTIKNIFSGIGGFFGGLFGATKAHTGAVVGFGGATPTRVSPLAFIGAPRYHGGGLPGLRRDEYATILKKREEVLSPDDPRNVLNGGKRQGPSNAGGPMQLVIDPSLMRLTMVEAIERMLATASANQ